MENPLHNLDRYRIILASGSPRRRELLSMLGIDFEVIPSPLRDESYPDTLRPDQIAEYLARAKAQVCDFGENALTVCADTTVVCGSAVLGKPADKAQAWEMLTMLSGCTHEVITGVAVKCGDDLRSLSASTRVSFATLTPEEIEWYIDRYRPYDKAGAYGIQEWIGCIGVTGIEGSYYNVMGLPLHRLYTLLKSL